MKTMCRQLKLSKIFFFIFFCLFSLGLFAQENKWEVAVVFLGENEDAQFQKDIDENMMELARTNLTSSLRVGIYREFEGKSIAYFPQGQGKKEINLNDLLSTNDLPPVAIGGTLKNNSDQDLSAFLKTFYKDQASKKALIIYAHGKGAEGLKDRSVSELKSMLQGTAHLDLLWFDACFMANMEFLFELRHFSDVTIASEEAEFSSGLFFTDLEDLPRFNNAKAAGTSLAQSFIESYSYLKKGKQRTNVKTSSATISVIENKKLENIAQDLKEVSKMISTLEDPIKEKFKKALVARASMDKKDLVDLGLLLIELRKLNADKIKDGQLTSLIRKLNIESVKSLRTSPRVNLNDPAPGAKMVFGFNDWQDGNKADVLDNGLFDQIIKHDEFVAGPHKKEWPSKTLKGQKLVLSPFAPGINTFNYYFLSADGKLLTNAMSVSRTHDIVESYVFEPGSPLVYTAYTEQIGTRAERYTGLNITVPGSVPSLDYFELEFNGLSEWLHL